MKARIIIVVLSCVMVVTARAQEDAAVTAKRSEFVTTSFARLTGKASDETVEFVAKKANMWRQTKRDDDWVEFTDAVYHAASTSGVRARVEISTSGGPGASVRYQSSGSGSEASRRLPRKA